MNYTPTIPKEVLNTGLHIGIGALFCYALVPQSSLIVCILMNTVIGGLWREIYQEIIEKKHQDWWIHLIDIIGWQIGACIYFYGNIYFTQIDILTWITFNINMDLL